MQEMALDRADPALRVTLMPKDTNALGTIFGGVILSYIDQAGAVEAFKYCAGKLVTVSMQEVTFHEPVFVGDLVSFYAEVYHRGNTSIGVRVIVEAQRRDSLRAAPIKVTEAQVVYVHVGSDGRPRPLGECDDE